ncbi:hypothetical protein CTI14_61265, partial [Methylobacterium radiotolerans]
MRLVVDLIRGKSVTEAEAILRFLPRAASEPVAKVLNSAKHNALQKYVIRRPGYAIAKYVRMSPRKVRLVVDLIRGKSVTEAEAILRFLPRAASEP